jgi:hypothetical protein
MKFLKNMLTLLEQANLGQPGKSLFLFELPGSAEKAIVLLPQLSGTKIDHELPGLLRPGFQLVVRARDHLSGYDLANAAVEALTMNQDTQLDGILVKFVRPRHEPVPYPVSEGNYIEWSVNFDATYVIV